MKKPTDFYSKVKRLDNENTKDAMEKMFNKIKGLQINDKIADFLLANYEKFVDNISFLFEEAEKVGLTKDQFGQVYFSLIVETIFEDFPVYYTFVESAALDSSVDPRVNAHIKQTLEKESTDKEKKDDPYTDMLKKCSGGYKN